MVVAMALLLAAAAAPRSADAAQPGLEIVAKPGLQPEFAAGVQRYAVRCKGRRTRVAVSAPGRVRTRIAGRRWRSGSQSRRVRLEPGQEVMVRKRVSGRRGSRRTYRIRCLPSDFPEWIFRRASGTRADGPAFAAVAVNDYAVIFDRNGVPVWWRQFENGVIDFKVLDNGKVAWWTDGQPGPFGADKGAAYEIRSLRGRLKRTLRIVGGQNTDLHDLQPAGGGEYLVAAYKPRPGVDLTAYGESADATVLDALIQRVDRSGKAVWQWDSADHIGLEETGRWYPNLGPDDYDIVHLNSMEVAGDSVILSFRHTDAVYGLDGQSGEIEWKLGGTTTPESLKLRDDPHGDYPFGGQHDARIDDRGRLSVFDNQTDPECAGPPGPLCPNSPRGARYAIDPGAGKARHISSFEDPKVSSSWCCGAFREDGEGGRVATWGGSPLITGFSRNGTVRWRYDFSTEATPEPGLYRMAPAPAGALSQRKLRRAMNAAA